MSTELLTAAIRGPIGYLVTSAVLGWCTLTALAVSQGGIDAPVGWAGLAVAALTSAGLAVRTGTQPAGEVTVRRARGPGPRRRSPRPRGRTR